MGHRYGIAGGKKVGDYLTRIIDDSVGMDVRLTVPCKIQRGGSATVLDRVMAYKSAVAAVDALDAGQANSIMVFKDRTYRQRPGHEAGRFLGKLGRPPKW